MRPDESVAVGRRRLDVRIVGHRRGAENMAADRALLERGAPAVRLYGWRPACVSLGYTQKAPDAVDQAVAAVEGLDIVERPTGGGAILHDEAELTYAVVLPNDWPGLPKGLFASYRYLSAGVVEALRDLGLGASYREARGGLDAFCYMREAGVSVTVGGRKISGGAQRRASRAVLQHGTVIVQRDAGLLGRLFRQPATAVREAVTSLADEGVTVPRARLESLLAEGFRRTLAADEP